MPADGDNDSAKPSGKEGFDRIFLSYARGDDEPFVRRLHGDLTKAGFDVWFDRVSMRARSLTFHQEIRDAIAARQRLILVVGPKAITSDYVMQEWLFAYYAANKCVNPIVRLDGRDSQGNKVDGYALIPEDLKLLHAEDFRRDAEYADHLKNLIRQLSENLAPVGKLVAVPELPPGYRAQPERLKALRVLLLLDLQKPVVVTGAAARVGLQGMGGVGKSVLANALAHHPEVQRAFQDGIYWVTLGQQPRLEELQRQLAIALGGDGQFNNRHEGKEHIRKLLADRAVLLILDDVWERDHADAFNVVSARSRILLTTRDAGLVTALAAHENHYRVELPTLAEAQGILAGAADVPPDQLPPEADAIIKECGRLPLALALCGGMINGGSSWPNVLAALREHDLEFLSNEHPDEPQHQNAWKAMDISVRVLPAEEQQRFAELAVFGADTGAPDAAVATLWEHTGGLNPRKTEALLAKFIRRSLVQRPSAADGKVAARVDLHDLLHHFATGIAIKRFGSLATLHQRLLDAYGAKCPDGWPSGPDDGYFFQQLCYHLIIAERDAEVIRLLFHFGWMQTKITLELLGDLLIDLDQILRAPSPRFSTQQRQSVQVLRDALGHSFRALVRDRRQLRNQLFGRLGRLKDRPQELENLLRSLPQPKGLALLSPTLTEPDNQLVRIIAMPGEVDAVVVSADGRLAVSEVSASRSAGPWGTPVRGLVVVDLESGSELRRISVGVRSLALTPCCRSAVAGVYGPRGNGVALVDLQSGQLRATAWDLTDDGTPEMIAVTPDGRFAVTGGGGSRTAAVWDLQTYGVVRRLRKPGFLIHSLALSSDGRHLVCGGELASKGAIVVWNFLDGTARFRLDASLECVDLMAIAPGRPYLVFKSDHALQVLDLDAMTILKTLPISDETVTSVCFSQDASCVIFGSSAKCDHASGSWRPSVGTVSIWDWRGGVIVGKLHGHVGWVCALSAAPNGKFMISGASDCTIRIWDFDLCVKRVQADHPAPANRVAISARKSLAASSSSDGRIVLWDSIRMVPLRAWQGHDGYTRDLAFALDGEVLLSVGADCKLKIWETATGNSVRTLPSWQKDITALASNSDRDRLLVGTVHGCLGVLAMGSDQPEFKRLHSKPVLKIIALAEPNASIVFFADGLVKKVDQTDGAELGTYALSRDDAAIVTAAGCSSDGIDIIFATFASMVNGGGFQPTALEVLSTAGSHPEVRTIGWHQNIVTGAEMLKPQGLALSASWDATVRLWDLATGECVSTATFDYPLLACALAHDTRIVVGDESGKVHFLRVEL